MLFCTIITPDYLSYALALRQSLMQFSSDVTLCILMTEENMQLKKQTENHCKNIFILSPAELCETGIGKDIFDKYFSDNMDAFRWSMKPVLLKYLLEVRGADKAVYVDCDIHFYSEFGFLFEELDSASVLLTPHWRSKEGAIDEFNFFQLYIYGLYNGGFVGVNKSGIEALNWWARANFFICEVDASRGQYVDQTHLNLLPVYFDRIKSLKHRGCNVADWNLIECERTMVNGQVLINKTDPIVFIHFTMSTVITITTGRDPLLRDHLRVYFDRLKEHGNDYEEKVMKKINGQDQPEQRTFSSLTKGAYRRTKSLLTRLVNSLP